MKKIIYSHFLPILISLLIGFFLLKGVYIQTENSNPLTEVIQGSKKSTKGYLPNLVANEQIELELVGSLLDKNGVTLFGSSELTNESDYIPYNFLPDSIGLRLNAFGHAFNQSFSIYCQLLAMKEYLKDAKICILISPGWFETNGTNIDAFLENVKPNFINRIIHDQSIKEEEKIHIGRFLSVNEDLISNPSVNLEYLMLLYKEQHSFLGEYKTSFKESLIPNIEYSLLSNTSQEYTNQQYSWNETNEMLSRKFINSVKTNKYYITDEYYSKHANKKNGEIVKAEYSPISISRNQELQDFELLIKLLSETGAKPIFVVQGLNPYCYSKLEKFNPYLDRISQLCTKNKFPMLSQYVDNEKKYTPGILNDLMHMGDLGWQQVNQFIVKSYYESK